MMGWPLWASTGRPSRRTFGLANPAAMHAAAHPLRKSPTVAGAMEDEPRLRRLLGQRRVRPLPTAASDDLGQLADQRQDPRLAVLGMLPPSVARALSLSTSDHSSFL